MKTNRWNNVSVVLGRLLYIGFSIQIVFGIIWMAKNIGYVQMFGDASYNVTLSGVLSGDGDTGVLYPAIVLLTRALGEITFVPWYSYLYILQIMLAVIAGYLLMAETKVFGNKRRRFVWGSLVLATFPPIMQIHTAILVNSFLLSLFMLQAVFIIKAWKCIHDNKSVTADYVYAISGVALFWLLMSLTKWFCFFIGAIPVVATFIAIAVMAVKNRGYVDGKRNPIGLYEARKIVISSFVTMMLFCGLVIGIDKLTNDTNLSQRGEVSIDKLMFERLAWKAGFGRGDALLTGFNGIVDSNVLYGTMLHQDNIRLEFEPELESKVGIEEAERLYRQTNLAIWKYSRSEVIKDFAKDMAGYAMPQVMLRIFLEKNKYITYTPRNYDSFKRNSAVLSKYYMDYSLLWFVISLIIGVIIIGLRIAGKLVKADRRITGAYIVIGITCICIAIRNVMLGNCMYDYKEAGSAMVTWFMILFTFCGYSIFDEDVK